MSSSVVNSLSVFVQKVIQLVKTCSSNLKRFSSDKPAQCGVTRGKTAAATLVF